MLNSSNQVLGVAEHHGALTLDGSSNGCKLSSLLAGRFRVTSRCDGGPGRDDEIVVGWWPMRRRIPPCAFKPFMRWSGWALGPAGRACERAPRDSRTPLREGSHEVQAWRRLSARRWTEPPPIADWPTLAHEPAPLLHRLDLVTLHPLSAYSVPFALWTSRCPSIASTPHWLPPRFAHVERTKFGCRRSRLERLPGDLKKL